MRNPRHEWPIGRWRRGSSKEQNMKAGTKEMAERQDGNDTIKHKEKYMVYKEQGVPDWNTYKAVKRGIQKKKKRVQSMHAAH